MNDVTELIPLNNDNGEPKADARQLHKFLGSQRHFSNWIKERIDKYGFIEGIDYSSFTTNLLKNQRGRPPITYMITLDMAKQLCMVENNERGMQARKYFIECERRLMEGVRLPKSLPEALRLAADLAEENERKEAQLKIQAPKVESFDQYMDASGSMSMLMTGKVLGIGQNKLYQFLRDRKVLMNYPGRENPKRENHNKPYQRYMDRGWFIIKPGVYNRHDRSRQLGHSETTRVTTKGLDGISKLLSKREGQGDLLLGCGAKRI